MSLTPFRSVFDDPIGQGWLTHDPFRDTFFGGLKTSSGLDMTRPIAPLLTADLIEQENEFKVVADLPGVDPADLEVTIDDNILSLKAERKHVHEINKDRVHRLERSYGSVQRKIILPKNTNLNEASVNFKNGVLCVSIPKGAPVEPKKLEITA